MYATAYRLDVPLLLLAPLLLLGLAAIATLAVYVSLINDLSDRAEDSACGKRNGLFGKSPRAVAGLLAACILPGALFTYYWRNDATLVALYLGGWVAFSAYSVPPVRLKSRGIWGIAADALGAHVMPKLFATLLIYRHQAASVDAPWLTAVSVWSFCYGLRGIMWHQLMDRGNDAAVGLQTFVRARDRKTLRRLAHGIVFPCEVVALVYMLWLTASLMAAACCCPPHRSSLSRAPDRRRPMTNISSGCSTTMSTCFHRASCWRARCGIPQIWRLALCMCSFLRRRFSGTRRALHFGPFGAGSAVSSAAPTSTIFAPPPELTIIPPYLIPIVRTASAAAEARFSTPSLA
jgi:hypothetical protein